MTSPIKSLRRWFLEKSDHEPPAKSEVVLKPKIALFVASDRAFFRYLKPHFALANYTLLMWDEGGWREMAEKIKPDYLVLDDRLPHRKGRHLLRAIRQDQSFLIPILLLTEHCIADDLYANTWVYWGDFFVTVPLGNGELKAFFTRAEETPSTFLWKWSVPWAEDPELLEKYPYLATENPKRHEW